MQFFIPLIIFVFLFRYLICTQHMLKPLSYPLVPNSALQPVRSQQNALIPEMYWHEILCKYKIYGIFVSSICKRMKIIKILCSICFSNICLIPRVAVGLLFPSALLGISVEPSACLGQRDHLLSLCL